MNRFTKEQVRLRGILAHRDHWLIYSPHSRGRQWLREVTEADIRRVLTTGQVTWYEVKIDEIVHVEGRDVNGRRLRVVVALRDHSLTLKVITVIEPKGQR